MKFIAVLDELPFAGKTRLVCQSPAVAVTAPSRPRYNMRTHLPGGAMIDRIAYSGITFDDVLLEPGFSDVLPREADVRTLLTRNISLNIPILSSPMDTVTESDLAIALAQEGGIGVIHKNISVQLQTREVDKVKRSENG